MAGAGRNKRKRAPEDNGSVQTVLTKFKESYCQGLDDKAWKDFRGEILSDNSAWDLLQNKQVAIPLLRVKLEAFVKLQEKDKKIKEKDKKIKEKDKKIKEKDKKIKEIDKKIKEIDKKIKERDKKIKEKDKKIKEKDKELQGAKETLHIMTIAGLLDLKDSSRFKLDNRGKISSHTQTNHRPAKAEKREFKLCPVPNGESLQWGGLAEKWKGKSSTLLSLSNSNEPLDYSNEADVEIFVHATVLDAVFICNHMIAEAAGNVGNVQKLMVRREASLLSSNKPDHTVIFEAISGIDILTIEDKKPCKSIETKETVLGQLHDCLSALASFGHSHPFGILTTFEQTWVGWIFEEDSQIAASSNKLDFDNVAELVPYLPRSDGRCPPDSTSTSPTTCSPSSTSRSEEQPLKKANHMVYLSNETFKAHELVPLLCNAILCGLQGIMARRQKPLLLSTDVGHYGRFLKLTKNAYDWLDGKLPFTGKPASKPDPKSKSKSESHNFIVVQLLGVGETSRAFRAVNMDGDECVVKMYVRKYVGNTPLTDPDFKNAAEESCCREVKNYHDIYGDEVAVWTTVLNGFHCVILPYFQPVQKQNRKEGVAAIKTVLTKKFKPERLCFAESDISWRHVGMFNGLFYLYDLTDLEKLEDDDMVLNKIKHHLDVLNKGIEIKSKSN